jgi:hypothetical protein
MEWPLTIVFVAILLVVVGGTSYWIDKSAASHEHGDGE